MDVTPSPFGSLLKTCRTHINRMGAWVRASSLGMIFPPHCVFCGDVLNEQFFGDKLVHDPHTPMICDGCLITLAPNTSPNCGRCARPTSNYLPQKQDCPNCRGKKLSFSHAISLGVYFGQMRETVLRMKKSNHEALTASIGWLLGKKIAERFCFSDQDLIVSVPTHWSRRMSRGINQSELLAIAVAQKLRIPARHDVIRCRRKTEKQGTLSGPKRWKNVRGAFEIARGYDITGARILVVDDVMTTSATASEVARTCKKAGAADVQVAVVARGIGAN